MNDTTPQMQVKQFEIYQSKSREEKFQMVIEMMEFGVNQTKNTLSQWYPKKSSIEFFKLYYRNDFDNEKMEMLVNQMVSIST
ncbi:MAG: hypothetical protein AAFU33_28250 [Bacteroidota bacterium]